MSNKNTCGKVWGWIIQLLLWFSIIFVASAYSFRWWDAQGGAIAMVSIVYLIYVISAACSPMCSYLFHKHGANSIHEVMKGYFYSPPIIEFHVECYHYETRHHHHRDSDGKERHSTTQEKVVTYRGCERFNFYSWRDISGLFLLDSHKVFQGEKKVYIKLALDLDFDMADDITRMDYQMQKDNFYNRNRWRDSHINFWETKNVTGFNAYNMVRISHQRPACVNGAMYLFFTFIFPFIEFYKIYVDSFCIEQDFKVKKVVSTRYNLMAQEHAVQWVQFVPVLTIFNQPPVVYSEAPTPMHNTPNLPSMDELENAKSFSNRVNFTHEPTNSYVPHFQNENNNQPQFTGNNNNQPQFPGYNSNQPQFTGNNNNQPQFPGYNSNQPYSSGSQQPYSNATMLPINNNGNKNPGVFTGIPQGQLNSNQNNFPAQPSYLGDPSQMNLHPIDLNHNQNLQEKLIK